MNMTSSPSESTSCAFFRVTGNAFETGGLQFQSPALWIFGRAVTSATNFKCLREVHDKTTSTANKIFLSLFGSKEGFAFDLLKGASAYINWLTRKKFTVGKPGELTRQREGLQDEIDSLNEQIKSKNEGIQTSFTGQFKRLEKAAKKAMETKNTEIAKAVSVLKQTQDLAGLKLEQINRQISRLPVINQIREVASSLWHAGLFYYESYVLKPEILTKKAEAYNNHIISLCEKYNVTCKGPFIKAMDQTIESASNYTVTMHRFFDKIYRTIIEEIKKRDIFQGSRIIIDGATHAHTTIETPVSSAITEKAAKGLNQLLKSFEEQELPLFENKNNLTEKIANLFDELSEVLKFLNSQNSKETHLASKVVNSIVKNFDKRSELLQKLAKIYIRLKQIFSQFAKNKVVNSIAAQEASQLTEEFRKTLNHFESIEFENKLITNISILRQNAYKAQ